MRQALHILRKDLRGHWYEIAITIVVTAVFAYTGAMQAAIWRSGAQSRGIAWDLVLLVLPLTWWALIARVIHAEALPGDRQFWLTRPYRRGSLLGAKTLLILLCVNVPMLLASAVIVSAYGFSISTTLPGLAWREVLLTAVFILPIAALSAITTGLVQLALALSAVAVAVLFWGLAAPGLSLRGFWFPLEWIRAYYGITVAGMVAVAILIWQYMRRRTGATRSLAVAGIVLVAAGVATISWPAAFRIQSAFSKQRLDEHVINVRFAEQRKWATSIAAETDHVRLNVPLIVEGVPADMSAKPEGLTASFVAPDGSTWKIQDDPPTAVVSEGQLTSLRTKLPKAFYERVKEVPLRVRGTLYLTLFGNPRTARLHFRDGFEDVPGAGRCEATQAPGRQNYFLLCDSAFRPPKGSLWAEWMDLESGRAHGGEVRVCVVIFAVSRRTSVWLRFTSIRPIARCKVRSP